MNTAPPLRTPACISCVIPCLNEAQNLPILLSALFTVLGTLAAPYEILVVDDGSQDDTRQVLQPLLDAHPQLVLLELSRNFGKEAAISAGLRAAKGEVEILMDADLQHPPALLPQMLARWQTGVQMVYAVRSRSNESRFKRWGSRFFYRLMRPAQGAQPLPENAGDFRLLDRSVVDALLLLPERNRFMKGLFAWVGFRSEALAFDPPVRLHGHSTFRPLKLLQFALDGLTAFTTWPLRVVSLCGVVLSLLSFGYGFVVILSYFLYGEVVQGWPTLITVVLFSAGVNLISIGVLGEYVARIFNEVKQRPLYLVQSRQGQGLAVSPQTACATLPERPGATEPKA